MGMRPLLLAPILLLAACGSRTWLDGWPVGGPVACHEAFCRATIGHAIARLDELEPAHPAVAVQRTYASDIRNSRGVPVRLTVRGAELVVVLSLADGTSRIRLVSCGQMLTEPIGCADWSLEEVEALVGDQ